MKLAFVSEGAKPGLFSQGFVYASPVLATSLLLAPVAVLQGIYASHFDMALTTIATVILVARLFDAVSDPLIGYFSDRYYSRYRTRKPFMAFGGIIFIISGYFLYVPPADVSAMYFAISFIFFFLGWTLFEIPHLTWGGELSSSSTDKTRLYSFRTAMTYTGLLMFYAIPLLPFFNSQEITPQTLHWTAVIAALLLLPLLVFCLRTMPDSRAEVNSVKTSHDHPPDKHRSFKRLVSTTIKNKPLLMFLAAYFSTGLGIGLWYGLIFIYVVSYLGMGEDYARMFLLAFLVGIIATPAWYCIARLVGKKWTWASAILLMIISFLYTGLLEPGKTTFSDLLILKVINTLGLVCLGIIAPSVLSDIVDYSRWKFRANNAATYFSIYTFVTKTNAALGNALGLAIAGWFGFQATAASQSESSIYGLQLAICWIPVLSMLLALIFIVLMPINAHRHNIVRRRLEARKLRVNRA